MNTLTEKPMGLGQRVVGAAKLLVTGKRENPLAGEPQDQSRGALVRELNDWCVEERKFWKPVFDFIREEQRFAAGKQWPGEYKDLTPEQRDYIGDMVQQMVNRKTATLYAKNPTPEAVLRDRLNFTVWDGRQETITACKQLVASIAPQALASHEAESTGQPVDPPPAGMQEDLQKAQDILADYAQGMQEKARLDKISRTGELLIKQQWDGQSPDILVCAKQAVTQVITSRVAFAKVMFKRDLDTTPAETANDMGLADKIAGLQAQLQEITEDDLAEDAPQHEQARLLKESLQREIAEMSAAGAPQVAEEGVVLDWLSATSVIVDRRCTCLKEFIGAHRVAHEMMLSVSDCEKKYRVNLRDSGARLYTETGEGWRTEDQRDGVTNDGETKANQEKFRKAKVCVWHIEDKDTGQCYVVCDGVKDFLKEPYENEPEVNRFWSIVALTFNAQVVETNDPVNDVTIYPRSDVRLMMPMQINVNKAGQEKRLHRAANRPWWVGVKAKFASTAGQNDLEKLARPRAGHDVLMMEGLNPGEKIGDFLMPGPKQEFDANLYENSQDSQAMMLATGQQPSDIGAQRPDEKATGQNIAAAARADSVGSNIDDLNFFFSTIAQMFWEMDIQEMSLASVQRAVGRGAMWPELSREDVAESVYFQIKAGSMGRPNQAAELQKIQTLLPQIIAMLQAMGRSPEPFLKLVVKVWDAHIDVDALLAEAQVLPPPTDNSGAQKPPSLALSMNFKDAPPEVQEQIEKLFGFTPASPESHIVEKAGHATAIAAAHANAGGAPSGAAIGGPEPKPPVMRPAA